MMSQTYIKNSTPPPVPIKTWSRQNSRQNETTDDETEEKPKCNVAALRSRFNLPTNSLDDELLNCSSPPQSPTKSSQPTCNVAALRSRFNLPTNSLDDELLNCSSTPQSPTKSSQPKRQLSAGRSRINLPTNSMDDEHCRSTPQSPTKPAQRNLGDSTLWAVLPNTWSRQNSGQHEVVDDRDKKTYQENSTPPPLPIRTWSRQNSGQNETTDNDRERDGSSVSYKAMTPWRDVVRDLQLKGLSIERVVTIKAEHLYKAIKDYIKLMDRHGGELKELTLELQHIADNLDKVSKGTKIAGITGGASSVAGGVAAAAGVILAPFTAGASLALTVVGAGVAAAGGVTGASAAIANKANLTQDNKKIEKTLQEFKERYEEILTCLKFINEGMDLLKQHGLALLEDMVDKKRLNSWTAASVVQLTLRKASAIASDKSSNASGMLDGFRLGMDYYFTKDGKKVKRGLESKLAKKLRKIAEDLDLALKELYKIKDVFSESA